MVSLRWPQRESQELTRGTLALDIYHHEYLGTRSQVIADKKRHLNQRSLLLFQTQISWWEGLEVFAFSQLPSTFPSTVSVQEAQMLLLRAVVPPPLLVKGLPLTQGPWEGRGEDSLAAFHHHPGPRTGHALRPGAGSRVPREAHGRRGGCPRAGGLRGRLRSHSQTCLRQHKHLTRPFHLHPASLPSLDQRQLRCVGTRGWSRGALQPRVPWGKEIQAHDLIGNRVLPWVSTGVFLPAVPRGPWKSVFLYTY